jgi:dolichol-phosphate mannosyltransferase
MASTLIVTPTYNERDNLPTFIARVRSFAPDADILVVDDGSPDGTGDVADAIASRDDHVSVLHRPGKLGLGTAYVQAFRLGLAAGYERFFEMDADLSHDAAYLEDIARALRGGADLVIGSRNVPGGRVEGWGLLRQVISKGGSLYSRALLGVGVRDVTSGYRAFTRRALLAIGLERVRSTGFSFQVEMTYRAIRSGLRVVEVPIVFVDRQAGRSKMSWKIFVEALRLALGLRIDALRGVV